MFFLQARGLATCIFNRVCIVQYCEGFYSECVRGGREWVCFVTVSSIAACMQIVEEVGSKFHLWPWCVTVYCNVCHINGCRGLFAVDIMVLVRKANRPAEYMDVLPHWIFRIL